MQLRHLESFSIIACLGLNLNLGAMNIVKSPGDIPIEGFNKDDLLVWDLHYTLVQPAPKEFWYGTYEEHRSVIDPILASWEKQGKVGLALDYLTLKYPLMFTDNSSLKVLQKAAAAGLNQIALTAMQPERIGDITDPAARTYEQLKVLGLESTDLFKPLKSGKSYLSLKHINFVQKAYDKGDALVEILKESRQKFRRLILIEDEQNQAKKALKKVKSLPTEVFIVTIKNQRVAKDLNGLDIKNLWQVHENTVTEKLNIPMNSAKAS